MPRFRTADRSDDSRSARRIYAVGAVFALCFGALMSRAVAFHLKDNADLEKVAMRQYRTAVRDQSARGKILDAAGRELAIDVTVESVFANPREIENSVEVAGKLSALLKTDRATLLDRLSTKRKFVWVERWVTEEEAKAVKEMGIAGIYTMRESKRSYPNGSVGASVLGAVGYDSEPLGGVELQYDDDLSARSKDGDLRRDARGHLYLSPTGGGAADGVRSIELTIDKTLQYTADRALAEGVKAARASSGEAVVVDVASGAVLAMSSYPTFDPNDYGSYPLESWKNVVIVAPHEPGSTFKVIAASAALEYGAVTPDEVFDCENGKIKIGVSVINDAHPHSKLTVANIIKVSSNIGAYKIVHKLGREKFYGGIRAFGFGSKTGIDLPGEASGIVTPASKWSPVQLATVAFGQGIAATPLQMAMAFAAIANGGKLMKPHVVRRVTDDGGAVIREVKPEVVSTPISPETARVMTGLLKRVVEAGGTGTLAASSDYEVAGKTGTAQKVDPRTGRYAMNRYYASFVGFAPADSPRVAVYVGMDDPRGSYYGGQVAAPVFRRIMEETLRYLKVPATRAVTADGSQPAMPLPPADEGAPPFVAEEGSAEAVVEHGEGSWRLPDFRGLTMRGVMMAAGQADIQLEFRGSGIAVGQSPEPGSVVGAGERCTVEFRPML
jgi:cell division protein FtsI (penicillin-binding protein 3)